VKQDQLRFGSLIATRELKWVNIKSMSGCTQGGGGTDTLKVKSNFVTLKKWILCCNQNNVAKNVLYGGSWVDGRLNGRSKYRDHSSTGHEQWIPLNRGNFLMCKKEN
jgi:hypothetical protein